MGSNRGRSIRANRDPDAGTRSRLLEAAAREFAEKGYDDATVRDVCRRAQANVAAVNYHFGGKAALHVEALRWAMKLSHEADTDELVAFSTQTGLPAADRLVGTIRRFALGMLAPRESWHLRLIFRELTTPSAASDALIREFLGPRFAALRRAVSPYLMGADERTVTLHVMSVIGQILYHRLVGPVALRFLGAKTYTPELAEQVVEHVVEFTQRSLESRLAEAQGLSRTTTRRRRRRAPAAGARARRAP